MLQGEDVNSEGHDLPSEAISARKSGGKKVGPSCAPPERQDQDRGKVFRLRKRSNAERKNVLAGGGTIRMEKKEKSARSASSNVFTVSREGKNRP